MIRDLEALLQEASSGEKMVLAVAAAEDLHVLEAVEEARERGIVEALLVGDLEAISTVAEELDLDLSNYRVFETESLEESAEKAVELVREGQAHFLMKGLLDTSILMKAVLNKERGLRTKSLLSHVMVYQVPTYDKLLLLTDGGMNIAPSLEEKAKILDNGVAVGQALGIEPVKVACLAAKEKVSEKMQSTVDAKALEERFADANDRIVEGPLAFDLAISKEAAETKKFNSRIAGEADLLLVPTIEMGNGIGKSLTYMAKAESAGIIMGAKVPIVLVSRADSAETKLYSIALGRMIATKLSRGEE